MNLKIQVLFQDEHLIVVKKESGMHVHPPENKDIRVEWNQILLYRLKKQVKQKLFPVHRLDVATSGILVLAFSSEVASHLCKQFSEHKVIKKYQAVVRGFISEAGVIDLPLALDSTGEMVPASTQYQTLKKIELNYQVSPKYPKTRYSLVHVEPKSGRYHQIRRHFNRISAPIVGDNAHGDSHHNRFFREKLKIDGLCLVAHELQFCHPMTNENLTFSLSADAKWESIYHLFENPEAYKL